MEVLIVGVLSVNGVGFRARKKPRLFFTGVFPMEFSGALISKSSLRDLCGLCAMLSPWRLLLRPEATVLPIEFSGP